MITRTRLPAAPPALTTYLDRHGDLPPDVLLGRIVLFTISDEPVDSTDIEHWFDQLDLDPAFLPAPNKAQHAFEKATSETKDVYRMPGGREGHLSCRDVAHTGTYLRRQMLREIKDGRNRMLDYHRVIDCTLYKPSDPNAQAGARLSIQIVKENLEQWEYRELQAVAQAIRQRFVRYLEFLDGMKLRATVRDYLRKRLDALAVKGGVYLVHVSHDTELAALCELVNRFGGGCQMVMIPVVNLERERTFFGQIFQREATQQLADLATKIEAALADPNVGQARVDRLATRYAEMSASTAEHMATLRLTDSVTEAASSKVTELLAGLQRKALRP